MLHSRAEYRYGLLPLSLLFIGKWYSLVAVFYSATSNIWLVVVILGFALVIFVFSTIRYRLDAAENPRAFKGIPIALITAALMAMAFLGFSGLI